MNDYYAVLGIEKSATKAEIKAAYRFLAAQLHPDKHQGQGVKIAEKKLKELNEAYEVLYDEVKRAEYDNVSPDTHGQIRDDNDDTWIEEINGNVHIIKRITSEQWMRIIRAKEITESSVILDYVDATQTGEPYPAKGYYYEVETIIPQSARSKKEFSILGVGSQDIYSYGNSKTGKMKLLFYPIGYGFNDNNCISLKHNWNEYIKKYNQLIKLVNGEPNKKEQAHNQQELNNDQAYEQKTDRKMPYKSKYHKSKPQKKEQFYNQQEPYNDYLSDQEIDQKILHESNTQQSESKNIFVKLLVGIIVFIIFANIVKSCPTQKEPNRTPSPRVEYTLPVSDGSSITVNSDILTRYFGISYEQRQSSNLFMKDSHEYRYNGNGTWTITRKSAVNNTSNSSIDTNSKTEVENYLHGLGF
jgi:curved DNA-binding protein CbpA